jgi:glutamate synthase (NADPH/NADH) large chain
MSGKSLPYAMSMLIPESWNEKNPISPELKAFYQYHSTFLEPWDGPASLIFSATVVTSEACWTATDFVPSRYVITKDDLMVMGSEVGVQTFAAEDIREKGRLKPGKIILVDVQEGKIYRDEELKEQLALAQPYTMDLDQEKHGKPGADTGRKQNPARHGRGVPSSTSLPSTTAARTSKPLSNPWQRPPESPSDPWGTMFLPRS